MTGSMSLTHTKFEKETYHKNEKIICRLEDTNKYPQHSQSAVVSLEYVSTKVFKSSDGSRREKSYFSFSISPQLLFLYSFSQRFHIFSDLLYILFLSHWIQRLDKSIIIRSQFFRSLFKCKYWLITPKVYRLVV